MAEAVGVVVDDQQPCVDHGPHCGFDVALGQVDDRGEQLVARVAADRRHRTQHQSCVIVEIGDLGGDQVGEHDGDGLARQVSGDEFAGEERVAATSCDHLVDELARRRPPEQRGHALGNLVAVEPFQVDSMSGGQPGQLGQSTPLGRLAGDLVGSVGADEHDPLVDQVAGEVLEQIPRHRVGPVQVFEPDDHCSVCCQLRDQLEDGDEQPAMRRAVQLGHGRPRSEPVLQRHECRRLAQELRVPPAHLAQQIGEWRQRNGVAADVRRPPQEQFDAGTLRALADDRGLADSGIAADQHDRGQPVARIRDARDRRWPARCAGRRSPLHAGDRGRCGSVSRDPATAAVTGTVILDLRSAGRSEGVWPMRVRTP